MQLRAALCVVQIASDRCTLGLDGYLGESGQRVASSVSQVGFSPFSSISSSAAASSIRSRYNLFLSAANLSSKAKSDRMAAGGGRGA